MLTVTARRAASRAALVLAALALGACDDNDITEDDEPEIAAVRLTITPAGGAAASSVVSKTATAAQTVNVRVGTSTVTAVPLDANNNPITLDEPFQLRIVANVTGPAGAAETPLGGVVTFAPTGNATLTGTLNASTSASITAWVRLVHVEEAHSDFDRQVTLIAAP